MIKFFRNIRKKLLEQGKTANYLKYAIGEIILVVIGILIALQVNNWNENRKMDERFLFGLRELHSEILSTAFYESAFKDKLKFQLIRIDSILNYPDDIPLHRLPGIIELFDEFAIDTRDNHWKSEYLEIIPGNEERNNMAKAPRAIVFGQQVVNYQLKENNLHRVMSQHLRKYDIPIQLYQAGTGYEEFINRKTNIRYTDQQLENVKNLIKDPSFIANLMTLKAIKENIMNYMGSVGFSAESFLHFVEQYDPKTNYKLNRMEIIGTGLPNGQWASGNLMKKVSPDNENIWQIEQLLVDGFIKFRADGEWVMDWGKGESDPKMLVFKGGNIPVKKGKYRITINIKENKMDFKPLSE